MAVKQQKQIKNCRALLCIKENNQLVTKHVDLFGSVRVLVGKEVAPEQIAQLVYDLKKKKNRNFIKLELATGGEPASEPNSFKNWFPGSSTYGHLGIDSPLYDSQGNYISMVNKDECPVVEILDILDAAMLDPNNIRDWKIKYHIKTNVGDIGYINALNVSDIFYKVK